MINDDFKRTALFVIDVQVALADNIESEIPDAKSIRNSLNTLIEEVREINLKNNSTCTLIFVQHNDSDPNDPLAKGKPTWELVFKPNLNKGEWYLEKNVRNTFESNIDLSERLKKEGINKLVICGIQTECCVRSTILGALENGFKDVTLLKGAHSTYPSEMKTLNEIKQEVEEEVSKKGVKLQPWKEWLSEFKQKNDF